MRHDILAAAIAWVESQEDPQGTLKGYVLQALGKRKRSPRPKWAALIQPVPTLKKDLDRVFSLFIRQRDSDENGYASCVTCGLRKHWKEMDASHYQPRQDMNTRWDEKNVHIACKACNGFRGGEQQKMSEYIDHKYGHGTAELLQAKARIPLKLDRHKLSLWIRDYKSKIGE